MTDWQVNSIDQADQRLKDWVENVSGGIACSFDAPSPKIKDPQISCYLIDLLETPPLRNITRPPLQLILRYLLTSWGADPLSAHQALGKLVFAAMEEPDLELEIHPPDPAIWTALGIAPCPSFFLRVRVRLERPEPAAHLVMKPLKVESLPVTSLSGRVLGPAGVPVMGAVIEIPALQLSARSGPEGRFRFHSVPESGWLKRLVVRVRGQTLEIPLDRAYPEDDPLIVQFVPMPGKEL